MIRCYYCGEDITPQWLQKQSYRLKDGHIVCSRECLYDLYIDRLMGVFEPYGKTKNPQRKHRT